MTTYIADTAHYTEVLTLTRQVRHSLWIGTADIKDLYVDLPSSSGRASVGSCGASGQRGTQKVPLLGVLAKLIERGVEVRLIHAKEPGPNFREDLIGIRFCSAVWSVCYVLVCISKCLYSMGILRISVVRT